MLIINTFMCLSCPLNLIIYCGMSKQFRENFYMLFGVWKPYVDPNVITMKSSSVFDNVKCPYIVKLCVHFCVFVSKSLRKWTQTDTKVTFHPPPPPTTTRKLFLVSNERYGKNKTFLLRWYGIDFALIKRYRPFCFLWLYIRRQRLSLYDLSTLCP